MMRSLRQLGVVLAVAVLGASDACGQSSLGGATGSFALEALSDSPSLGVHDRAGLFHLDAVIKARTAIQAFRQESHRDLFVETFPQVPANDRKHVHSLSRKHQEQFFADWAKARARAIGVDGVYILLCKDPKHVQVLVYPNTPEQAFSEDNAKDLRKRLERQLPKAPDSALLDAVAFVDKAVKENLAEGAAAATSIRFETVATILAILVGAWFLLSLVRAFLHWARSDRGDSAQVGLMAGFFAASFGTTAGHWIYDHVFHAHGPAVPAPESDYLHTPPPAARET